MSGQTEQSQGAANAHSLRANPQLRASKVETTADKRFIVLHIEQSSGATPAQVDQLKYPLVWLRDNCQCDECFNPKMQSRTITWTNFDINCAPKQLTLTEHLDIVWNDDHVSAFNIDWLLERNFSKRTRDQYLADNYRPTMQLWSKEQLTLKKFEANDVYGTDEGLVAWLMELCQTGVAIIKNVPLETDQSRKLADRIAFMRRTQYGEEYSIRVQPDPTNFSYTANPLQFHTDLPYYAYKPGVTILHCISQTNSPGALSLLVDGFYLAERLRKENPKAFRLLTNTPVNWSDYGDDRGFEFIKILRSPIICLDNGGNVTRVDHSIAQRDSFFSVDADEAADWYAALKTFIDMMHAECINFKLNEGDILAFDNTRLLHGRTGYTDTDRNVRHLAGTYMDWDEIYSRLRVLNNKKRN